MNVVDRSQTASKAVVFSIIGNILLAAIKWVTGLLGNSYALVADAIESTSDIVASFLVLMGIKYANRPADKNHPYGHGRAEPLVTFIVVMFLFSSALLIAYQSIINIRTPHEAPKPFTLYVLAGIILWKEISYRYVIYKSKQVNSSSLKAEAWHHRSDAITSLAAFIGIFVALFLGEGYESADDWAALGASAFILYNCYTIFRPALGEIMDEHTHHDLFEEIKRVSAKVPGICDTEKCFIRKAGLQFHIELHAKVDAHISVKEGHDLSHHLKDKLREEIQELGHITIHIEPFEKK